MHLCRLSRACLAALLLAAVFAAPAHAATPTGAACANQVARDAARVLPASLRANPPPPLAQAGEATVGLTFVGHATFLIESPGGIRIATDYNDAVRPSIVPDVATMNHAHATHFTDHPDPRIRYVLRGWGTGGGPPHHDLQVGDVRIRNVLTNIRGLDGGTELGGNSIFVFETGGLCIAHLGHLHHTLTAEHLAQLGHVDVVLVPVDGGWTMDLDGMVEVLAAIDAPLMIPMHYFTPATLRRFLERIQDRYTIRYGDTPSVTLTRSGLPAKPEMLVLPGN